MITFETQEDFEEAVKAVIRGGGGSLGLGSVAATNYCGNVENGYLCLQVDGETVSSVSLG